MKEWRFCLKSLKHFKTLRLEASHRDAYANGHWIDVEHHLYVEDLLMDSSDPTEIAIFRGLKTLTLLNCSLNLQRIQIVAAQISQP